MKTKLFLIALAFGLMSSTCTPEEQQPEFDCECETVYYDRVQTGWNGASPVYTYVIIGSTGFEPADCLTATEEVIVSPNGYYKVNCQTVE